MKPSKEFWLAWGITVLLALTGVILLFTDLAVYGVGIFCILPTVIGFVTGIYTRNFLSYLGIIVGLLSIFLLLISAGEGIFCIVMALPIVFAFVGFGYLVGFWVIINRNLSGHQVKDCRYYDD